MARPPLYIGRRDPPIQTTTLVLAGSLLVGALANGPVPLPLQTRGRTLPLQTQVVPGWYANANTSAGTPLTLRAALPAKPSFNAPAGGPDPRQLFKLADTTYDSSGPLTAPIPATPQTNTPNQGVQWSWQVQDTTRGTAKTLYGDQIPPAVNALGFQISMLPPVVDTSRQSIALQTVIPAPFSTPPQGQSQWIWAVNDTSKPSNVALLTFVAPSNPTVNLPQYAVQWPGQITDTSKSTAKTLYGNAVPPTVSPVSYAIAPVFPTPDTSQSSSVALTTFVVVPLPPGNQTWFSPLWAWQNGDTTNVQSIALQTAPPPPPPTLPPPQGAGWIGERIQVQPNRLIEEEDVLVLLMTMVTSGILG